MSLKKFLSKKTTALINFIISTFIVNTTSHIIIIISIIIFIIIIIILNAIHLCNVCQRRQNKPGIKQNKSCNCLDRQVTSRHSHMHDVVKYWGKNIA